MGMIPIHSEDSLVEASPEDESRVEALERKVAHQDKRISDLESYAKLQTCSIEHLFSICRSLQDASEMVSYMLLSLHLVD